MINACAGGYHYGFTGLKMDILRDLPRFVSKNKPDEDSGAFTGRVTGLNSDDVTDAEIVLTAISDSYGAFAWMGVIVTGLLAFPAVFIVYESMFDIRRPWGIVAAGGLCVGFAQVSLGGLIGTLFRTPAAILLLSYAVGIVIRMIPVKGDVRAVFDTEPAA
jgi:hypothetical protein